MKKVALVTGASAGIDEATVKRLVEQGYKTYAAARRLDRMYELEQAGATLLRLDPTADDSNVQAVERVRAADGRIDVLVNNPGYGSGVGRAVVDAQRRMDEGATGCLVESVELHGLHHPKSDFEKQDTKTQTALVSGPFR
jgi:NADP-dependent 3-hydroxy acid dehydrogenase YdfG